MRRVILTVVLLMSVIQPVSALEITAPEVPPSAEEYMPDTAESFGQGLLEILQDASGVIVDHVITSPRIFDQFCEMLQNHSIYKVRVTCPLPVLIQREIARKNRCIGSAESSYTYLFPQDGYDLVVNTHENSSEACAAEICQAFF